MVLVGDTFDLVAIGQTRLGSLPAEAPCGGSNNVPQSERIIILNDSAYTDQSIPRAACRASLFSPADTLIESAGVYALRGDTLSFFILGGGEYERENWLTGKLTADSLTPVSPGHPVGRYYVRRVRRGARQ